jgi:hypothetical protein
MKPDDTTRLLPWSALDDALIARFADPARDLFASHLWFDTLARAATPPGLVAGCAVLGGAGIIPVWCREAGRGLIAVSGQSSPYSLEFAPIITGDPIRAGRDFAPIARRAGVFRLDALDDRAPALTAFFDGCRRGGLHIRSFAHFGDWSAPVATDDFARWLAGRPGSLRSTITRKLKRARAATAFRLFDADDLETGIAAFEQVYAKSWKQPEPFPSFNSICMRALAGAGLLRLGVLADRTGPIAAQYWAVSGGRAMLLKLAHDEAQTVLSPGTVLTAQMLAAILERDRPMLLDFGRGDDPYKRLWVDQRHERQGALLINPRHPRGLAALAHGAAGTLRRRLRQGPS